MAGMTSSFPRPIGSTSDIWKNSAEKGSSDGHSQFQGTPGSYSGSAPPESGTPCGWHDGEHAARRTPQGSADDTGQVGRDTGSESGRGLEDRAPDGYVRQYAGGVHRGVRRAAG